MKKTVIMTIMICFGLCIFGSVSFSQQDLEFVEVLPTDEPIFLSETNAESLLPLYEQGEEDGCPYGLMLVRIPEAVQKFEDGRNQCLEIEDRRAEFAEKYIKEGKNPNYIETEDGYLKLPTLGGIGSGVTYKNGFFPVTTFSKLSYGIIAWPNGINLPTGSGQPAFAVTSTNRTRCGAEVALIYSGTSADIIVEDWGAGNCTQGPFPFNEPLSNHGCWMHYENETETGKTIQVIDFANETRKVGTNQWQNFVAAINWCTFRADVIHSSTYISTAQNCANGCQHGSGRSMGWWGPIIETFNTDDNNLPQIKKLGIRSGSLYGDAGFFILQSSNTNWTPPRSTWTIFYRTPNNKWAVGNFQ